jgi:hypothetical protein
VKLRILANRVINLRESAIKLRIHGNEICKGLFVLTKMSALSDL